MELNKHILLIAPNFFDYYLDITKELEKNGYKVTYFNDRPSDSFLSKAMLRLKKNSQQGRIDKYVNKIVESTKDIKFDKVFVLLGQCFSKRHIQQLKEANKEAEFIFYSWDAVKNFPNIRDYEEFFYRIYTFDDSDVEEFGYRLLPLFYCNEPKETEIIYDYSTVITIKNGKLDNYYKIKEMLPEEVLDHGYECLFIQSKAVYFYYKLKLDEFKKAKMKDFVYKKISREEFIDIINKSKVVIDCQMKNQVGLTMRTFEALRAGKKIITTNPNVKKYDFYTPDNIYVVEEGCEKVPLEFFNTPFNQKYKLSEKYSLANFVKTILGEE